MARQLPKKVEKTNARVRMLILIVLVEDRWKGQKRDCFHHLEIFGPESSFNKESGISTYMCLEGSGV